MKSYLSLIILLCVATFGTTTYAQTGAALDFDGVNDYALVPNNTSLNVSQFTIETWIKWDRIGTAAVDFICGRGLEQMEIHLGNGTSSIIRFIPAAGVYLDAPANAMPQGTWTHLACVYNPSIGLAKMYVNGNEVTLTNNGANPLTTTLSINGANMAIGARSLLNFPLKGQLDEFRVWNKAFTQAEIQAKMNCEIPTSASGLIVNYHFNQGTAAANNTAITTVTDASGNNNNAALTNFTLTGSTSNFIAIGGVTTTPPSVTVATNPSTTIVAGTNVSFTATPANFGSVSQYQWYLNNVAVGANSVTYSNNNLANGDAIKCTLTLTDPCGHNTTTTSNPTMMLLVQSCSSNPALKSNYFIPPDASYTSMAACDDCFQRVVLPFSFTFFNKTTKTVFINNNGSISLDAGLTEYAPTNFPRAIDNLPILAGLMSDVDTRVGNVVKYKINPHSLIATWQEVRRYPAETETQLKNTFQIIISDGTDPVVGIGQHVAFRYGDIQWLTTTLSPTSYPHYGFDAGDRINYYNGLSSQTNLLSTYLDSTCVTFRLTTFVLPVEILKFSGYTEGSSNRLVWTTANEINSKGFQVERLSPKTNTWESIGYINSKGKAAMYDFTDKAPFSVSYYRLRQIDNDGKETLSKVISLSNTAKSLLKVYPNPATDVLTVEFTPSTSARFQTSPTLAASTFEVINVLGQIILRGPLHRSVDVAALPSGTYILRVGLEQVKFVKQ
jgi:hypothetical protein